MYGTSIQRTPPPPHTHPYHARTCTSPRACAATCCKPSNRHPCTKCSAAHAISTLVTRPMPMLPPPALPLPVLPPSLLLVEEEEEDERSTARVASTLAASDPRRADMES